MSQQDIEILEKQFQEAFNAGDAAGVARFYAEDARLLPPNTDILEGRPAIEGFMREFFLANPTLSFGSTAFHESGDLAVAIGTYELELRPEGAEAQKDSGKYIEVWKRQPDGSWLIAADMFNTSLPAS